MRIHKFDGLRGIFSLMIVVHHLQLEFIPETIYNFYIIRHSQVFVDFFFVLSGFVISYNYIHLNSYSDFLLFMKKRVIRLYPLVVFTVVSSFIFKIFTEYYLPGLRNTEVGNNALVLKTIDSLLLTDSTPILGGAFGINGPNWSVSSEMISYLTFGLIMINGKNINRNLVFIVVLVFSSIFILNTGEFFQTSEYGFIRGLIGFILGYFLLVISKKIIKIKFSNNLELIIPIVLMVSIYISYINDSVTLNLTLIPVSFVTILLILLKTNGFISKFLENNTMQYLGKISFSIYLTHTLVITVIPYVIFRIWGINKSNVNLWISFILIMVCSIFYSHFTYNYIEIKIGKYLKRKILN